MKRNLKDDASTARRAEDVMRCGPPTIPADEAAGAALSSLGNVRERFAVSVSGDEVVGVLDCFALIDAVSQRPENADELVGNLAGVDFRLCRRTDDLATVRRRMRDADVPVMIVSDEGGSVIGLILRTDLA